MDGPKMKWKKVLYEDQGVPDNYTDETFLEELRKNINIRTYDFWTVVNESGVVSQQICSTILFVAVFIYMDSGDIRPEVLFFVSSAATFLGYLTYTVLHKVSKQSNGRTAWLDLKSTLFFLAIGFGLSPVLMTLTETISTDTIYAMTVAMLLANLLFNDYGTDAAIVSQPFSLNAAIFASVCLASRLPSTWHAFATVTFAVETFALWPVLRRQLKSNVPYSHPLLTVLLGISAVTVIWTVSRVGAVLLTLLLLFISLFCPALLIRMQPFKNTIYGPWDEAVLKE